MKIEKELPKRKSTRLKNFDYGSAGAYFVTICVRDRMRILSEIVNTNLKNTDKTITYPVGEGLPPPEFTTDKTGAGAQMCVGSILIISQRLKDRSLGFLSFYLSLCSLFGEKSYNCQSCNYEHSDHNECIIACCGCRCR